MVKQILKTIWKQRNINVWLWVELVIVFICLSYVTTYLYSVASIYLMPESYDIEHVYNIELANVPQSSDEYIPHQTDSMKADQLMRCLERIRTYPDVESACIFIRAPVYTSSYATGAKGIDSVLVHGYRFDITPTYFTVFKTTDKEGHIEPLVEAAMQANAYIVSEDVEIKFAEKSIVVLENGLKNWNEETASSTVRAVTGSFRFNEFSAPYPAYYSCWSEYNTCLNGWNKDFAVRFLPEKDTPEHIAAFRKTMKTQLRIGNIYLIDMTSYKDIRNDYFLNKGTINEVKTYIAGIMFLLLNIILGVIGTFWIRTQQRRSEIALRMALGSSKNNIGIAFILEGVVLLLCATIPAMLIWVNLVHMEVVSVKSELPFSWGRLFICQGITFLFLLIMIMLGIHFPARSAMKIQPAEALHEE